MPDHVHLTITPPQVCSADSVGIDQGQKGDSSGAGTGERLQNLVVHHFRSHIRGIERLTS
jgi:hypothetical protein